MSGRLRLTWPAALAVALLAEAGAAHAMDAETLKLMVGELALPSITFQLGISMTVSETALVGLGDPVEALKTADQRIAQDANDAEAHLRRGMALEVLGRPGSEEAYARAAYLYRQAMDVRPDDVPARVGWAKAKMQLEAWDDARDQLQLVAALESAVRLADGAREADARALLARLAR